MFLFNLNFFRKKTKRIEDLELEVRIRKNCTKPDEIFTKNELLREIILRLKDPKFLLDSISNKQMALNSFFKSKIEFYILELEKYENENKKLKEQIFVFESNNNNKENYNNNQISSATCK